MKKRLLAQSGDRASVAASDSAVRCFRATLRRWRLEDEAERSVSESVLRRVTRSAIRMLGKPYRAVAIGIKGVRRYGEAISAKHGVSKRMQFLRLSIDHWLNQTDDIQFYLNQFYFPEPYTQRRRHVTYWELAIAHTFLTERFATPDLDLLICKDKFAAACIEKNLPTVPIVSEIVDGQALDGELPSADLFAKPADNFGGYNTQSLRYDPSSDRFFCKEWQFLPPMRAPKLVTTSGLSKPEVVAMLCKKSQGGKIIVQRKLRNHSDMVPITNGSLATIRVVTYRTPSGEVDMLPPAIRIPVGMGIVDNFLSGGIAAPLDRQNGAIIGPGIQRDRETVVRSVAMHPDTGFSFIGFVVPRWPDVVQLALRAHLSFPNLLSVGWDIAVLQDGPILLEGNSNWGPNVLALPHCINISDTPYIECFCHYVANLETTDRPPSHLI